MKKIYLLLLFLSMGLPSVLAQEVTYTDGNGAVWTFANVGIWNSETSHSDYYWTLKSVSNYGDDITVPNSVTYNEVDYPVEVIGEKVFQDNKSVTRIILPSTIKRVRPNAFYGCSSLKDIGDLSHCEYIYSNAFQNCISLEKVDLTSCVTIEWGAFQSCQNLQDVKSIANVTSIDGYAFCDCKSLKQVDLPASVSIGSSAFQNCSNLQSVGSLANATIEYGAFRYCNSLKNVDLSTAKKIGEYAFYNCTALESVGDLSAITGIDNSVFYGCSALKSVDLSACKTIGSQAFCGCSSLTEVNLAACQTLGTSAFGECTHLKEVKNFTHFTSVPESAFNNCQSLETIDLSGCTSIGNDAFIGCQKLGDVVLASTSLQSLGNNAFNHTGTLTLMTTTPPTLGSIGEYLLVKVPAEALATYQAADGWKDIATRIFGIVDTFNYTVDATAKDASSSIHELIGEENLRKVVDLKVSGTINSYDIMIIRNKTPNLHYLDLTDARIVENSYEYYTGYHSENDILGSNSFRDLTKLLTVKLPNTIKRIGYGAFYGCKNLQSVTMYEGIETIGGDAFRGCSQLKSVTLPNGLITLESDAFEYCI